METETLIRMRCRATLLRAPQVRMDEAGRAVEGVADIVLAVYDVPDTEAAVGNRERQIIDQGAFRSWIENTPPERLRASLFYDHGDAMISGFVLAEKKIGYIDSPAEGQFRTERGDELAGLKVAAHYNMRTQRGSEAFYDLDFDPFGTEFSFRWGKDDVYKGGDGYEHVRSFDLLLEGSQVGFGAQELAGAVAGSIRAAEGGLTAEQIGEAFLAFGSGRAAIRMHSTATSDASWDGPAAEKAIADDAEAATFRKMYAWVDPEGDDGTKDAYRFPHHEVDADGAPGAANVKACTAGIGVLNGARGGSTIPDADRQGVYNHLSKHVTDSGAEAPALRTFGPEEPEAEPEEEARGERHKLHGDKVPAKPTKAVLKEWLKDEAFASTVKDLVKSAAALRTYSLDEVPQEIRSAWMEAHRDTPGDWQYSWPLEVFADDGTLQAGFVIVSRGWDYASDNAFLIRWALTAGEAGKDATYAFDEQAAEAVSQEWVYGDGSLVETGSDPSATATALGRLLLDPEFSRKVRGEPPAEGGERTANPAEVAWDDVAAEFYGRTFATAPGV